MPPPSKPRFWSNAHAAARPPCSAAQKWNSKAEKGLSANMAEAGQQEAGHSALGRRFLCSTASGHWPQHTQHTGARQHSSRRAAARAGGHSRGFGSDQPEFAAVNVFLPRTNQTSTSKTHHQQPFREPWNLATSPALAALRSWLLASQSMQLPRVHTRPRETQVRMNRETPPRHSTEISHGVYPEPSRTPVNSGPRTKNGRPGPAKGTWASSAASPTSFFSTPTSPAAGNLANKTEKMTAMTES